MESKYVSDSDIQNIERLMGNPEDNSRLHRKIKELDKNHQTLLIFQLVKWLALPLVIIVTYLTFQSLSGESNFFKDTIGYILGISVLGIILVNVPINNLKEVNSKLKHDIALMYVLYNRSKD